mgnify:CR=1 FL=1
MTSPLHVNGGLQLTESNSATSASLKLIKKAFEFINQGVSPSSVFPANLYLKSESYKVTIETGYSLHITLQLGNNSYAFTGNYTPSTYDATRMFLAF